MSVNIKMKREYYSDSIDSFVSSDPNAILGQLTAGFEITLEHTQRHAWEEEIRILQNVLQGREGFIYFEYSIPRMGKRIDVVLIIGPVVFVLEFKVGERDFKPYAIDQVFDYALDLKNFHESSHNVYIAPILIATDAKSFLTTISATPQNDKMLHPVLSNTALLGEVIDNILRFADGSNIDAFQWEKGRYSPTPTIIEAAMALYSGHSVRDISRSDASAINLSQTSDVLSEIIVDSKNRKRKSICFVTGVPGAGKTLVGLNIANLHMDKSNELYSVFLSGNGPLVKILREALARDQIKRAKDANKRLSKKAALSEVQAFIQNVHNFRDECLIDDKKAPIEHVALFDEAQRAWNLSKTADFMKRRKKISGFNNSEPEFLISCLNRHPDWAVIVCLVGGGARNKYGRSRN